MIPSDFQTEFTQCQWKLVWTQLDEWSPMLENSCDPKGWRWFTQWLKMVHPMVDQCSPNDCDPTSPILEANFQTAAYKDLNVSVPVKRGNMPASKPRPPIPPFPGWVICFSDFYIKICHQIFICIGKSPPISQILLSLRTVLMKISISTKKEAWSALYGSGGVGDVSFVFVLALRYESSTLIVCKELSSSIFQNLWVRQASVKPVQISTLCNI